MEQCTCWSKAVHLLESRKRGEQRRGAGGRREKMRRNDGKEGGEEGREEMGETKRGDERE